MRLQVRSEPFDVRGPTLSAIVRPERFRENPVYTVLPTSALRQGNAMLVQFTAAVSHSAEDYVGIARRGGKPCVGVTRR